MPSEAKEWELNLTASASSMPGQDGEGTCSRPGEEGVGLTSELGSLALKKQRSRGEGDDSAVDQQVPGKGLDLPPLRTAVEQRGRGKGALVSAGPARQNSGPRAETRSREKGGK